MNKNSSKPESWPGVIDNPESVAREYSALSAPYHFNALAMPFGIMHRTGSRKIDWLSYPEYRPKSPAELPGFVGYPAPNPTEILLQSLHYACLMVEKHQSYGSIYMAGADLETAELDRLWPYWGKTRGISDKPRFGGYEEAEGSIEAIIRLYETSPKAAEEITKRLAMNIAEGNQLSKLVAQFAAEILAGWRKPPTAQGKPSLTHRDTLLVVIAIELRERAGYDLAGNRTHFSPGRFPKPCGATIAAAALGAFGFPVQARTALNILNNKAKYPYESARGQAIKSIYDPPHAAFGLRRDADLTDRVVKAMRYFSTPISGS